jgi:hypothetical protein
MDLKSVKYVVDGGNFNLKTNKIMSTITIFLYILPAILSVIVMIYRVDEIYVSDLIGILLASLIPILNIFIGYVGGFMCLIESGKISKFLNKRVK